MYCVHLDTGQFYQANGTVNVSWVNPVAWVWPLKVLRVSLWGGLSIGSIMDFSAALYLTGPGYNLERVSLAGLPSSPGLIPLAYLSFDRYGVSNGQNYQVEKDWKDYNILIQPGQQLLLQANCVQHNPGTNPVIGGPAPADNAHAQAYIWMDY